MLFSLGTTDRHTTEVDAASKCTRCSVSLQVPPTHHHLPAAVRRGGIKNNGVNGVGLVALREQAASGVGWLPCLCPFEIFPPAAYAEPRHAPDSRTAAFIPFIVDKKRDLKKKKSGSQTPGCCFLRVRTVLRLAVLLTSPSSWPSPDSRLPRSSTQRETASASHDLRASTHDKHSEW